MPTVRRLKFGQNTEVMENYTDPTVDQNSFELQIPQNSYGDTIPTRDYEDENNISEPDNGHDGYTFFDTDY
jgi:hypothetical protein